MLYLFKEKTHQHDKDMHSGKSKGILFGLYIEFETYETFSLLFQILFRIRNIINKFALTNFYWNVKNNTKFSSFISSSAEMLYLFKEKTHEYDKDMHKLVHTIKTMISELWFDCNWGHLGMPHFINLLADSLLVEKYEI